MNAHFRFGGVPRIPVFHCTAKTPVAERFVAKYGEVINVQKGFSDKDIKGVIARTGYDEEIIVEMRDDGIYVNNEFFAKSWDAEEIPEAE